MNQNIIAAALLLCSCAVYSINDAIEIPIQSESLSFVITEELLQVSRQDILKQLGDMKNGLKAWYYTPPVFKLTAKNIFSCTDTDIAIFPFSQGMWHVTESEFIEMLCLDRLNRLWESVKSSVDTIHDVRYHIHVIACRDLSIVHVACGDEGYKSIEKRIKTDSEYAKQYKQHVSDGLVISVLYEKGMLV